MTPNTKEFLIKKKKIQLVFADSNKQKERETINVITRYIKYERLFFPQICFRKYLKIKQARKEYL